MPEEPRNYKRPSRFCGYCGERLNTAHRFCSFCGEQVENPSPIVPADPKVTPISHEARKVLEEFENQMAALRSKRSREGKSRNPFTQPPDVKVIAAIGIVFFLFLFAFFHFMVKYVSTMAAGGM